MNNELMIFNNEQFGKVRIFKIDNEPWIVGKDVAEVLEYNEPNKAVVRHVDEDDRTKHPITDELGRTQESWIINESGLYSLVLRSKLPEAKKFRKWVTSEILPQIRNKGSFDLVEQKLQAIEDETERKLSLKVYGLEKVAKENPQSLLSVLAYNEAKNELETYKTNKKIEAAVSKVEELEDKISKATVLREGDMSAEVIAKKFNIFSTSDKPHNKFAENLARDLGFYINPEGNVGYQDEYISINLTPKGGITIPTIKYSKKAYEEMERYILDDNLNFIKPPTVYKRNPNKGQFKEGVLQFENGNKIKVNQITYDLYNSDVEY